MAQFPKPAYVRAIAKWRAECVYDPIGGSGSWREQVKNCQGYASQIYPIRPLPNGEKHSEYPVIPNLVSQLREEYCMGAGDGCTERSSLQSRYPKLCSTRDLNRAITRLSFYRISKTNNPTKQGGDRACTASSADLEA